MLFGFVVDRLGQVLADLVLVDVEGGHELDVADVVAAELDVHQARDEVVVLGVLVVVAALDEAARAVADADDRDADLAVPRRRPRRPAARRSCSWRSVGSVLARSSPPGCLPTCRRSATAWSLTWTIRWMVGDGGEDADRAEGDGEPHGPAAERGADPAGQAGEDQAERQDDEADLAGQRSRPSAMPVPGVKPRLSDLARV